MAKILIKQKTASQSIAIDISIYILAFVSLVLLSIHCNFYKIITNNVYSDPTKWRCFLPLHEITRHACGFSSTSLLWAEKLVRKHFYIWPNTDFTLSHWCFFFFKNALETLWKHLMPADHNSCALTLTFLFTIHFNWPVLQIRLKTLLRYISWNNMLVLYWSIHIIINIVLV